LDKHLLALLDDRLEREAEVAERVEEALKKRPQLVRAVRLVPRPAEVEVGRAQRRRLVELAAAKMAPPAFGEVACLSHRSLLSLLRSSLRVCALSLHTAFAVARAN